MGDAIARPASAQEAAEVIAQANAAGAKIEIVGGGTKRAYGGQALRGEVTLSTEKLNAVVDYDPQELVLTVQAGARLKDIAALLAGHGQMLGFEPPDFGPVFGGKAGKTTIGGVLAANLSGPRRILVGAARDHFLGFEGVNGRGVAFKAGGKVVKNVTGFDLPKLMAGSWGTLGLLTTVTVKVMPRPKVSASLVLRGLPAEAAVAAMTRAQSLPLAVSGAAHRPGETWFRLEGFGPSVVARTDQLRAELASLGVLEPGDGADLWGDVPFASEPGELWRLSVPPARGAMAAEGAAPWRIDWGGALVWRLGGGDRAARTAAQAGGSAMLVRGSARNDGVSSPALSALSARVRAAFDPDGVFVSRAVVGA